jgi:hypothetical protein
MVLGNAPVAMAKGSVGDYCSLSLKICVHRIFAHEISVLPANTWVTEMTHLLRSHVDAAF